jgi:hypothetical protein
MKLVGNAFISPQNRNYFYIGSTAQYEKRISSLNVTCYAEDFKVGILCDILWMSACAGVGSTQKSLKAKASFQQLYND